MSNLNLANRITIIRIMLVPVIITISIATKVQSTYYNYLCLVIIVLFGLGDVLDGYVARKYDQITTLGAFLDPLADKYLVISCCMILTYYGKLPFWYLMLIFNKDLVVFTAWMALFLISKEIYLKPNIFGKLSTIFHVTLIFMAYLGINHELLFYTIRISAVIALLAGITYLINGLKFYRKV